MAVLWVIPMCVALPADGHCDALGLADGCHFENGSFSRECLNSEGPPGNGWPWKPCSF